MKIHFLCLDKSGSYIKICTREHFQSFYRVFYAATHFGFEKENCPGGKSFRKKKRGNTRTQGKKKKKKVCNCREWLVQGKEEETSVGEMIFRDN